jgi:hypothetical protein
VLFTAETSGKITLQPSPSKCFITPAKDVLLPPIKPCRNITGFLGQGPGVIGKSSFGAGIWFVAPLSIFCLIVFRDAGPLGPQALTNMSKIRDKEATMQGYRSNPKSFLKIKN